eukprot:1194553-Prorocentrum_minimum.AAC.4
MSVSSRTKRRPAHLTTATRPIIRRIHRYILTADQSDAGYAETALRTLYKYESNVKYMISESNVHGPHLGTLKGIRQNRVVAVYAVLTLQWGCILLPPICYYGPDGLGAVAGVGGARAGISLDPEISIDPHTVSTPPYLRARPVDDTYCSVLDDVLTRVKRSAPHAQAGRRCLRGRVGGAGERFRSDSKERFGGAGAVIWRTDLDELEERFGGVRGAIWSSYLDELEERFGGVRGAIWRGWRSDLEQHLDELEERFGGLGGAIWRNWRTDLEQ